MVNDGYKFAAVPVALGVALLALGFPIAGVAFLLLAGFVLYFFRDPERVPPADPDVVVSPADGRVVEVADEFYGGRAGKRVSIFLSIWDVHVTRAPVAGQIRKIEYRPGRFHVALRSCASSENEQNVIQLATPRGEMVFKQIAGWIARRVLCWKSEGDAVALGERVGMIRFGSRVDVWLPAGVQIEFRRGQHIAGGTSILGRWRAPTPNKVE
jgi:phosphatidylserine decarboxylase